MRYDNLRTFEKHLEEQKSFRFSPVYFILGQEPYECREAVQLLLRFLLPSQEMRTFGLSIVDALKGEETEWQAALYTSSFLSPSRVFWIQEADKLKKSVQEHLQRYLIRPVPFQYLLLSAASGSKGTPFYKSVEQQGVVLEFSEAKPWEKEKHLVEWAGRQAGAARKLASFQVCQSLVKRVGHDQMALSQELEKLICHCGEKKDITLQDLDRLCVPVRADSVWQLGEAIFRRDAAGALHLSHCLLMQGEPLLPLLRQMRSQFQTGYHMCCLLAQGKQPRDLALEFPHMKGQLLDRSVQQAQQYGWHAFKRGLLALDATHLRAKNSAIDEKILMELFIAYATQTT